MSCDIIYCLFYCLYKHVERLIYGCARKPSEICMQIIWKKLIEVRIFSIEIVGVAYFKKSNGISSFGRHSTNCGIYFSLSLGSISTTQVLKY